MSANALDYITIRGFKSGRNYRRAVSARLAKARRMRSTTTCRPSVFSRSKSAMGEGFKVSQPAIEMRALCANARESSAYGLLWRVTTRRLKVLFSAFLHFSGTGETHGFYPVTLITAASATINSI
jgi:hypothetical protein